LTDTTTKTDREERERETKAPIVPLRARRDGKDQAASEAAPPTHRGRLGHLDYKWIVLSVTTIGALMAAIDGTIVILALPKMMVELHASLVQMIWVIMGYLLVSTVFLLTFGRVADMLGRVRLYLLGFVVFAVGSALSGISQTALELILFRLVQGSGAALMLVNSVAIVTEAFPPDQRGRALGINAITFSAGGVIGPILGGFILTVASWRWIFFINVPIGILGAVWGYFALKEISTRKEGETFDPIGAVTFTAGLVAVLLALTLGIQFGWTSPLILSLFGLFVVMVPIFVWWEHRASSPVLDLSLFRARIYNLAVAAAMMQALALFAVNFLIVFYLMGVRGLDPLQAALLLIPFSLVMAFVGPLGGWISDQIGARVPATLGLLIQAGALVWLMQITPTWPFARIMAVLAMMGVGGGLFWSPNTSAAMNSAPRNRLGIASGALFTLRSAGMVTSFALALAVAAASIPRTAMLQLFVGTHVQLGSQVMQDFVTGIHSAFLVSLGLCLLAASFSLMTGRENRRAEVPAREERYREEVQARSRETLPQCCE
jgi:EmrB/QacA subfamily drug resistance transporter